MSICTYICIYTHIYACMCIDIYTHIMHNEYADFFGNVNPSCELPKGSLYYIYILYVCVYIYTYICIYTHIYVCMYVYRYIHAHYAQRIRRFLR